MLKFPKSYIKSIEGSVRKHPSPIKESQRRIPDSFLQHLDPHFDKKSISVADSISRYQDKPRNQQNGALVRYNTIVARNQQPKGIIDQFFGHEGNFKAVAIKTRNQFNRTSIGGGTQGAPQIDTGSSERYTGRGYQVEEMFQRTIDPG